MGRLSSLFPTAEAVDAALKRANKAEADIADLKVKMAQKVDESDYQETTDDLQNQINNIVVEASESGDVSYEVAQARGAYETLNERISTEYDELSDDIEASSKKVVATKKELVDYLGKGYSYLDLDWKRGMIDGSTGQAGAATTQIYDENFYYVGKGSHVGVVSESGYGARINYYDYATESSFVGHTEQQFGETQIFVAEADYIRINAFNSSYSTILPSEGENIKFISIKDNIERDTEIYTTPDRGLASFDLDTNTITFPEYAVINRGNERFTIANKTLTFTSSSTSYFMLYNPETDQTLALGGAQTMNQGHLIADGYVRIGYRFGKFVSINIHPYYLVNGVVTSKEDAAFSSFRQLFTSNACAFLGDSISTFQGYSEPADQEYYGYYYPNGNVDDVTKTWWYMVAKGLRFDMNKISVSAISRSTFRSQTDPTIVPAYDDRRINRLSVNGYPALIFVNMGTNDAFGNDMGTMPTTVDTTELNALSKTSLYNTVFLTIRKIQSKYSNSVIVGIIPKWCTMGNSYPFNKYEQAMKVIEDCYNALGIYYIDLRRCGITQSNSASYTIDGIHPNANGMKKMARYVIQRTLEICRTGIDY